MTSPGWLARLPLAAIAVLALVWLGVLLRDHEVGQAASDRLLDGPKLSDAEFGREIQHLKDAELLNPESQWELDRGKAWLSRNRPRRASNVVAGLLRREPDNLEAWFVLVIARRIYHGRTAKAVMEINRLDPLGAARRQRSLVRGSPR